MPNKKAPTKKVETVSEPENDYAAVSEYDLSFGPLIISGVSRLR